MKKSYVKPEVTLVRFELSEAIASCGTLLYQNHAELDCDMNPMFASMGINVTEDQQCSVPLKGYCYFTSNSMLMNS